MPKEEGIEEKKEEKKIWQKKKLRVAKIKIFKGLKKSGEDKQKKEELKEKASIDEKPKEKK